MTRSRRPCRDAPLTLGLEGVSVIALAIVKVPTHVAVDARDQAGAEQCPK